MEKLGLKKKTNDKEVELKICKVKQDIFNFHGGMVYPLLIQRLCQWVRKLLMCPSLTQGLIISKALFYLKNLGEVKRNIHNPFWGVQDKAIRHCNVNPANALV